MGEDLIYPTPEQIQEYNTLALTFIKAKKADQPKILSRQKLIDVIEGCRQLDGDVYDKAVYLLKGLIQKHPFASGNRRTALITTKQFLLGNHARFHVNGDPKYARILQGIRENYYTDKEIKEWIKHGKIKEFKR